MKYKNFLATFIFLALGSTAWAELGGPSSSAANDLNSVHGRSISDGVGKADCYDVKQINGDGLFVKEFINSKTNTIFMIRTQSRIFLKLRSLLGPTHFNEYQTAQKNSKYSNQSLSRHNKKVIAETDSLKIKVIHLGAVHRSSMLLKTAAPTCVVNPETLP